MIEPLAGGTGLFDVAHAGRNAAALRRRFHQFASPRLSAMPSVAPTRVCLLQHYPFIGSQRSALSGRSDPVGYQGFWITVGCEERQLPAVRDDHRAASLTGICRRQPRRDSRLDRSDRSSGPYKIIRWPTKSVAAALQLPSPACHRPDLVGHRSGPLAGDQPTWPVSARPRP